MSEPDQEPRDEAAALSQVPGSGNGDQVRALNELARHEAGALVDGDTVTRESDPEPEGPRELPRIVLPGEGRTVTNFAREAALACQVNGVYRRDSIPVIVNRETGGIENLLAEKFCTELEQCAVTVVQKTRQLDGEEIVTTRPKTMTTATAKVAMHADSFIYGLRKLERVNMVRQPIIRRDGRMDLLPVGYDGESGILTMDSGIGITKREELADLDEKGREAALHGAVGVLRSALKEFPFVDALDVSVQVASMLSFYGALLLPLNTNRLNFCLKANKHRSGKTLLIQMTIAPVMGKTVIKPFPRDENELTQLLNTTALSAKSYLVVDDIHGHLKSEALNGFLTAPWWGGRLMHTQRDFEAKRQAVVYASGHELTLSPDLAGRFLECRLHVEEADASEHRVKSPIDEAYLTRDHVRGDLLSALHTIIVLWDLAGRPKGSTVRPGFEEWCRIYGGLVEFAGFGDPVAKRADDEGTDPEYDDMLAMVKELVGRFEEGEKRKDFVFSDLIEVCLELNAFTWFIDGAWKVDKETHERWYVPSKKTQAKMGWMFGSKYGGTTFHLAEGKRVRFGQQGKNRQRRYTLELL